MAATPQSKAYHVRTYTGSAWRTIGTFFRADCSAPEIIRGHYVFYRPVKNDRDLFLYRRQSNGFSTPVFERVKRDGATYMVTHSKESGRMVIGHEMYYTTKINESQGLQTHAPLERCTILDAVDPLSYPKAIPTITVQDEQATPVQPSLPVMIEKKAGTYRRCGCRFVDGQIDEPCQSHAAVWAGVMANKKAS